MNAEQYDMVKRLIEEDLKEQYEANQAIVARVKDLEEICVMAIAACSDHSPMLSNMLLVKAEGIFGKKLKGTK